MPSICCNLQISNNFCGLRALTLPEAGTYTAAMGSRHIRAAAFSVLLLSALAWSTSSRPLLAQALQRSLHVTVLDASGNDVSGLGPADFIVTEDKARREVLRVEPATDPMQIALLVDDSPAVEPYLQDVRTALTAFVTAITADAPAGGKHQIALITLSSRPTIKANYTFDKTVLLKASNIFPQQATRPTLLDGIDEAAGGLAKRHATRPVIVAVTTETEDVSFRVYDQVLESLADSGATLYVLDIGGNSNNQRDRSIVLGQGTEHSGGALETLLASNALGARMMRLAGHLTHQYLVTYARPNSLIPPEQVSVSAAKPGLKARGTLVKTQ
jgi:hypothetical protein